MTDDMKRVILTFAPTHPVSAIANTLNISERRVKELLAPRGPKRGSGTRMNTGLFLRVRRSATPWAWKPFRPAKTPKETDV
jgi:hypothetical protein